MDLAAESDLRRFLEQAVLPSGWRVHHQSVVRSTMELAREAALAGAGDREVFTCDLQTAGRGRQARVWSAPLGQGLLFTVLLRSLEQPLIGTMAASVALCEAIEELVGLQPRIKWPNDLMLADAKLAGVLAESFWTPGGVCVAVGCGVNVNQNAADLEPLGRAATSLRLAPGRPVSRGELLVRCLERFESWLQREPEQRQRELHRGWRDRLWAVGRTLRFRDLGVEFAAVLEGVDLDGALLVRPAGGAARRIVAGEIVL
jgi:BirA family biotin operon repressor/biotin-[acetyl-CoA-carboxylase] ligase